MKLDQLELATQLRNERDRAIALRRATTDGVIVCAIDFEGVQHDVLSTLSRDQIAAAIREYCSYTIIAIEKDLQLIGIRVKDPEPHCVGTAEEWKREAGMYQQAWMRELRGHIGHKRHLIDALVGGTQEVVRKALSWKEPALQDPETQLQLMEILAARKAKEEESGEIFQLDETEVVA